MSAKNLKPCATAGEELTVFMFAVGREGLRIRTDRFCCNGESCVVWSEQPKKKEKM